MSSFESATQNLTREYASRQRRYARNEHGSQPGRNCFNEQHFAYEIERLENLVEELGGNTRTCLDAARRQAVAR